MSSNDGWIKLHRTILNHWIWNEKPFDKRSAWLDLILRANHSDNKFSLGGEVIVVKRGSFITSELKLMERWGWSKSKVRRFLEMLQKESMIEKNSDRKKTTLTIVNYDVYQELRTIKKPQKDHQETTERPQKDTNKNDKNDKNEKKEKNNIYNPTADKSAFGDFQNVFLSEKEYEKLKNQFSDFEYKINELSEYMESTGKKYKSHYATIVSWDRKNNKKNDVSNTSFWEVDLND